MSLPTLPTSRLRLTDATDRTRAAVLHDPASRPLLLARDAWEVRGLPSDTDAPCRLEDRRWLFGGLWHVQFFSPSAQLSVLAFPVGMRVGPFVISTVEAPRSINVSAADLDARLSERGLAARAESISRLTEILFDRGVARVIRSGLCGRCVK